MNFATRLLCGVALIGLIGCDNITTDGEINHSGEVQNVTTIRNVNDFFPGLRDLACNDYKGASVALFAWCREGGLPGVPPPPTCAALINAIRKDHCPEAGNLPLPGGDCTANQQGWQENGCYCPGQDIQTAPEPAGWLMCQDGTWLDCRCEVKCDRDHDCSPGQSCVLTTQDTPADLQVYLGGFAGYCEYNNGDQHPITTEGSNQ